MTANTASIQLVYSIMTSVPTMVNAAFTVDEMLSALPLRTVSVSLVTRLIISPIWCASRYENGRRVNLRDRSFLILSPTLSEAAPMM